MIDTLNHEYQKMQNLTFAERFGTTGRLGHALVRIQLPIEVTCPCVGQQSHGEESSYVGGVCNYCQNTFLKVMPLTEVEL